MWNKLQSKARILGLQATPSNLHVWFTMGSDTAVAHMYLQMPIHLAGTPPGGGGGGGGGGVGWWWWGVLPIWWVIHMCRGLTPFFWPSGYQTRSFWGVFSHPPTQKRPFGYKSSQNSIFLAPKYHFPLDLFGSNFQWPTAHPQQFSDRVPPPPPPPPGGNAIAFWCINFPSVQNAVILPTSPATMRGTPTPTSMMNV